MVSAATRGEAPSISWKWNLSPSQRCR
jgi:hypothetical protein